MDIYINSYTALYFYFTIHYVRHTFITLHMRCVSRCVSLFLNTLHKSAVWSVAALWSMEDVAEHINEMQRIHDEYGEIFDDLTRSRRTANSAVSTS